MIQLHPITHQQFKSNTCPLQSLPEKVRPNILKLLNQHPTPKRTLHLPTYSIFYLSPLSHITLWYNIIFLAIFYYIQVQMSLIIPFGQNIEEYEFQNMGANVFYWFVFGFFIADIWVNLHKGYYEEGKGKVCQDHSQIIMHYLKTQVYFDIPSTLGLIVPRVTTNTNVDLLLLIPIILLWIKKFKYQKQIVAIIQYNRPLRIFFVLTVLFLDVLLLGHYGACIFLTIDLNLWSAQYYGNNTAYYWLSNNNNYAVNLMSSSWKYQYVYAQSFSTGTLSTLAPGPFVKNPIEVCFALFVMIYFMLFASYIGEILINTLYNEQAKRVFHQQNIQDFDKYMTLKKISENLKTRVYNFFELIWEVESRLQAEQQKNVIGLLPQNIREELLVEMSFIKSFFMLRHVEEPKSLEKRLAVNINRLIIDNGSCLWRQANILKRKQQQSFLTINNIYYLSRGMVRYYITLPNSTDTHRSQTSYFNFNPSLKSQPIHSHEPLPHNEYTLSLSNSNKYLGLYEFMTKKSFQYCCKAIDLCEVDAIGRKEFREVLQYTRCYEIYQKLKYQLLVENRLDIINKVCCVCYETHTEEKCPMLNVSQQFYNSLQQSFGTITRPQLRQYHPRKHKKQPKPQKIFYRSNDKTSLFRQFLEKTKNKKQTISVFSQVLESSNIRLEELLLTIAKMDQIEEAYLWKDYFPQDNVDKCAMWVRSGKKQKIMKSVGRKNKL